MLDIGTWVMNSVMSSFQTYNITYSIPNIIVKSNMNVPTIMNPFLIRPTGVITTWTTITSIVDCCFFVNIITSYV